MDLESVLTWRAAEQLRHLFFQRIKRVCRLHRFRRHGAPDRGLDRLDLGLGDLWWGRNRVLGLWRGRLIRFWRLWRYALHRTTEVELPRWSKQGAILLRRLNRRRG